MIPALPSTIPRGIRRAGSGIALILLLGLQACNQPTPQEYLDRGAQSFQAGDYSAAVIELKNAVSGAPRDPEARRLLARTYAAMGRVPGALKELRRARELDPRHTDTRHMLAELLVRTGQFEEALEELAAAGGGSSPELGVLEGRALAGLGRMEQARDAFAAVDPDSDAGPAAELGLARIAMDGGNAAEGRERLEALVERRPDFGEALVLLAAARLADGEAESALEAYRRAGELLSAEDLRDEIGQARAHLEAGRPEAAADLLDPLLAERPDNPLLLYLRALAARLAGDLETADTALQRVLEAQPEHGPSRLLAGEVHYLRQDYDQARDVLRGFIARSPGHLPAAKLYAASSLRLAEPGDAVRVLRPLAGAHDDDPQLLVLLGSALLDQGDLEAGAGYLQQAARIAPEAAGVKGSLAVGHLIAGDRDAALGELRTAVDLNPDAASLESLLIDTLVDAGQQQEALQRARALAERRPDDAAVRYLLGRTLERTGDAAAARAAYQRALELNPGYPAPRLRLGALALEAGDVDSARAAYGQVLDQNPDHAEALTRLAGIAQAQGETERALELLRRARTANPDALVARLVLANYALGTGALEEALRLAEEAARIAPDNVQAQLMLGQARLQSGDGAGAVDALSQVAAQAPRDPRAHLLLGRAQARSGDLDGARQSLSRALELAEGDLPAAREGLAELALAQGRTDDAVELAQELQAADPGRAAGYLLEGRALERAGEFPEAARAYREALARQASEATAVRLSRALERGGEVQAAEEVLLEALDTQAEGTAARLALADLKMRHGDADAARRHYQVVLEDHPDHVVALNNLAVAQSRLGATGNAVSTAERAYELAPSSPAVMDTLGWLLVRNNRFEQGLRLLRQAAAGAPGSRDIRYHLAAALAQDGSNREARAELESILKDDADFEERSAAEQLLASLPDPEQ